MQYVVEAAKHASEMAHHLCFVSVFFQKMIGGHDHTLIQFQLIHRAKVNIPTSTINIPRFLYILKIFVENPRS